MIDERGHSAAPPVTHRSSDAGTTLTELLVAMTLLSIILAAAYFLAEAASSMADLTEARAVATDQTRLAMDRMTQELRQAAALPGGTSPAFTQVATGSLTFHVDEDHDSRYERVTYRREGRRLVRIVAQPVFVDGDYTFPSPSSSKVLVSGLDPAWSGPIFTAMLRAPSGADAVPISPSQIASASAVVIHLRNTATVGRRTAVVDNTTWVKVRAVENVVY